MRNTLATIQERKNRSYGGLEKAQISTFIRCLKDVSQGSKALSVSCGDGFTDYLALTETGITDITATDIVPCPVKDEDIHLLRKKGNWDYVRVKPDTPLPFEDNSFDVVFHHDVIEHTEKPYLFLREQHRVLRGGEDIGRNA